MHGEVSALALALKAPGAPQRAGTPERCLAAEVVDETGFEVDLDVGPLPAAPLVCS